MKRTTVTFIGMILVCLAVGLALRNVYVSEPHVDPTPTVHNLTEDMRHCEASGFVFCHVETDVDGSVSVYGWPPPLAQAPPVTIAPEGPQPCQEDEPCWDCRTMGNRVCSGTDPQGAEGPDLTVSTTAPTVPPTLENGAPSDDPQRGHTVDTSWVTNDLEQQP